MTALLNQQHGKTDVRTLKDYIFGRMCAGVRDHIILQELWAGAPFDDETLKHHLTRCREKFDEGLRKNKIDASHPAIREKAIPAGYVRFAGRLPVAQCAQPQSAPTQISNRTTSQPAPARPAANRPVPVPPPLPTNSQASRPTPPPVQERPVYDEQDDFEDAIPEVLPNLVQGREVECVLEQGEIAGLSHHTQTHARISRTFGGHQVETTTHVRTNFHVVRPDGSDRPYWFWNRDIPLRNGQDVTCVHLRQGKTETWTLLVNESSRLYYYMRSGSQIVFGMGALLRIRWWWALLAFLPFLFLGIAMDSDAGSGLIGAGFFLNLGWLIVAKLVQWVRALVVWKDLKPELEDIAQTLLVEARRRQ